MKELVKISKIIILFVKIVGKKRQAMVLAKIYALLNRCGVQHKKPAFNAKRAKIKPKTTCALTFVIEARIFFMRRKAIAAAPASTTGSQKKAQLAQKYARVANPTTDINHQFFHYALLYMTFSIMWLSIIL